MIGKDIEIQGFTKKTPLQLKNVPNLLCDDREGNNMWSPVNNTVNNNVYCAKFHNTIKSYFSVLFFQINMKMQRLRLG